MQICKFFADSKSRAQELSNDVSFVIFGHQTWDLEGGVQIDPPPSISWFSSTPAEIGLIRVIITRKLWNKRRLLKVEFRQTNSMNIIDIAIVYSVNRDVRYFPKGVFPSSNFPWVFFKVTTFQMCNFPSVNFPNAQFPNWQFP